MKRLFLLLQALICVMGMFAQSDKIETVNEALGQRVYISNNSALPVVHLLVDGKVKPASKVKNATINLEHKSFAIEKDLYLFKKHQYIILKNNNETYLFKADDAPLYLSAFRSYNYWQNIFDSFSNDYIYLDVNKAGSSYHSSLAPLVYDCLCKIQWLGFDMNDKDITLTLRDSHGNEYNISYGQFTDKKDFFFINKNAIQPYIDKQNERLAREKREKEIQDSIVNCKLRLAIAKDENVYGEEDSKITVSKGDTIAIYEYDKIRKIFKGRFHYRNLILAPEDIDFLDQEKVSGTYSWNAKYTSKDSDFLIEKGTIGVDDRFQIAFEYDSIRTEAYLGRLHNLIKALDEEAAYRKKNQIFITGIGYDYDSNEYSHRFGMYFDVYNCFSKTIKYIEFTMTNYNAVGDVQRDDIGRSSRTVKGIGPIDPEDGGRYSWDDIFWDDRDVIERTRLTGIKFIFKDGTSKVFSGYNNIKKHFTDDAWD